MAERVVCAVPGSKKLQWQILNSQTGAPVNITDGSARWQGKSADLPPVTVAGCSTTNGNATLTRAAGDFAADQVRKGMKIVGTNVPAGATVLTVSTTTLTMSSNATGTGSGLAVTFHHDIDAAAVILDGPNGIFEWTGLNELVLAEQLGNRDEATYRMNRKFTDAAGKADFPDPEEEWIWEKPPL